MDAPQKTEIAEPTPEQLLKLLDLQLARERGKRANKGRNRATVLITGMVVILAAVGVAVLVAQQMVNEVRDHAKSGATAGVLEENQ